MVNPSRVAFTIFGQDIYWYGITMALGIIVAAILTIVECKRKKLHEDTALDVCLVAIPSGIVGARLYYVLFELERYLADPISMLYIWEGGLAVYGSIIGGAIGVYIYCRKKKIRFLKIVDAIAPGLVLAQSIGRWGNFFNQEAFGPVVTDPSLLWFPYAVRIDGVHTFNGVVCEHPYHMATFFYESAWCFIVFLVLWFFIRKRVKHDGDVFLWYGLLYGLERMYVEGLRGDSLWLIPDVIRVSQALSAAMVVGVAVFFIIRRSKEKKLGELIWPRPESVIEENVIEDEKIEEVNVDANSDTGADDSDGSDAEKSEGDEADEDEADDANEEDK